MSLPVDCGILDVNNGSLVTNSTVVGSRGTVRCDVLFQFFGTNDTADCQSSGTWAGLNGSCLQVEWINQVLLLLLLFFFFFFIIIIIPIDHIFERERERNVLFNDALNTFYLRLYGVRHIVKDHSDSEKGNPLPPHRLLLSINSKGSFICTIPQT